MAMMGAASILLVLLLVAAAGTTISAAAVSGDVIRLPSDAATRDLVRAMARAKHQVQGDEKRPWGECCDMGICMLTEPPRCRCFDQVDRCSDACEKCEETEDSRHACADWYQGDPGPTCHGEHGINRRGGGGLAYVEKAAAAAAVMASDDWKNAADDRKNSGGHGDNEKRPWKCCDMAICTKSWPPICRCMDTVEQCASTCEYCAPVQEGSGSRSGGHRRYRCLDSHIGDPGPSCGQEAGGDHHWARKLALAMLG